MSDQLIIGAAIGVGASLIGVGAQFRLDEWRQRRDKKGRDLTILRALKISFDRNTETIIFNRAVLANELNSGEVGPGPLRDIELGALEILRTRLPSQLTGDALADVLTVETRLRDLTGVMRYRDMWKMGGNAAMTSFGPVLTELDEILVTIGDDCRAKLAEVEKVVTPVIEQLERESDFRRYFRQASEP